MKEQRVDSKSMSIRRATEADASGILACLAVAFEEFRSRYTAGAFEDTVLTRDTIERRMREMAIFVALDVDGKVAGTIACQTSEGEGHLRGMAVLPTLRGTGLAQELLDQAERWVEEQACMRITLDTTEPLERAMRFYKRNGFQPSGKVQDFFGMRLIEYEKAIRGRGEVASV